MGSQGYHVDFSDSLRRGLLGNSEQAASHVVGPDGTGVEAILLVLDIFLVVLAVLLVVVLFRL